MILLPPRVRKGCVLWLIGSKLRLYLHNNIQIINPLLMIVLVYNSLIIKNQMQFLHVFKFINSSLRVSTSNFPQSFKFISVIFNQDFILTISFSFLGFIFGFFQVWSQFLKKFILISEMYFYVDFFREKLKANFSKNPARKIPKIAWMVSDSQFHSAQNIGVIKIKDNFYWNHSTLSEKFLM